MKIVSEKIRRAAEAPVNISDADIENMVFTRRNPRLAATETRGRPKKGASTGRTTPRSVRFSDADWKRLEKCAKATGLSLHAYLRRAVVEYEARSTG